jgi:HEAT repeat protein
VPRRDRLRETLEKLSLVRRDPGSADSLAELRRVLSSGSSHAVAKAASIIGGAGIAGLGPDLGAAFGRFLDEAERVDQGCVAKTAIVDALLLLDLDDAEVFLRGVRHVQMEPVLGGRVDAAVGLRGASALGLARTSGADVLNELAQLLADPEPRARAAAAHAIGDHGRAAGVPVLRHKVAAGDEEPRVVTECLLALLHLDAPGSLPFVKDLLDPLVIPGRPARDHTECAADALGESRLAIAFPVLREWHPRAAGRGKEATALRALAMLRRDEAFEYLLSLVRDAEDAGACASVAALAPHCDESLRARVQEAASNRPEVAEAVLRAFSRPER